MSRLTRTAFSVAVVAVSFVVVVGALLNTPSAPARASEEGEKAEPAPPEGQTYTGVKRCAACHFQQFMAWKKTKHSDTFDLLTAKYEKDPKCLKCHTTGYGEPSGYEDGETSLQGTTCEACHGPGSEHEEICQAFGKKKLTEAEEQTARDSIWLMIPENICVECHTVQAHGKSETPDELKK